MQALYDIDCKAKLSRTLDNSLITVTEDHNIPCKYHNEQKTTIELDILTTSDDFSAYMAERVTHIAINDASKLPNKVLDKINLETILKYTLWDGMMKHQVINLVNNTRLRTFRGNNNSKLESPTMTTMKDCTGQQLL